MTEQIIELMRHIFDARIDNASTPEAYVAWCSARDIVEYALAGNDEALHQFDYLLTNEEKGLDI